MKCEICGTEFEGNICPACATPFKKTDNKNKAWFYKDPWFWVALLILICWIFNPLKNHITAKNDNNLLTSDSSDTVSVFFADTSSSAKAESLASEKYSSEAENSDSLNSKINITDSTKVYITPSGKRYHISEACAGKNKVATTVKEAVEQDKTPCQKCLK